MNDNGAPVDNPTYMAHIRYFFEDVDIDHMRPLGIDLATYEGVKFNALRIYLPNARGYYAAGTEPEVERRP